MWYDISNVQRGAVGRTGRVVWVYKIGLKWPVVAMAITRKPQSLSLSERDRELKLELWNLFYKDCSLGSVKNPSNNQSLRSYWWVSIKDVKNPCNNQSLRSYWWVSIKDHIKLQASFIYLQAWMSEWNLIHENFHTKHSVFTSPDVHMHTSLSYTLWAYNQ